MVTILDMKYERISIDGTNISSMFKAAKSVSFMDVNSFSILSMQIAWKVMILCVITTVTVKVNEYQRKGDFLRINFIISRQLI